jgi:hypothetical protein
MAKVKMAQRIGLFLCEHCASVHIGFWRNGQMFAEATPNDIEAVAADLVATIAESRALQGVPTSESKH